MLESLSKVEKSLQKKIEKKVPDAKGGLIAVRYAEGTEVKHSSLESAKDGVRVVYEIPEKNQILIDVSAQELKALRKKINEYGEKTKVSPLSKDKTPKPANNSLVAPIEKIEEAKFQLIWGLNLQADAKKLKKDNPDWFELSCRGGLYDELGETQRSRREMKAAFELLNLDANEIPEYIAPERIYFFVHCSLNQAKKIFDLTDCVFEIDLVPPATLNWLVSQKSPIPISQINEANPPKKDDPSFVSLDSGINSKHPLLSKSVALEDSVHPEDKSPVDIIGHGTEMAGIGVFGEQIAEVVAGRVPADSSVWIESVRVFTHGNSQIHSAKGRPFWAKMTDDAVNVADKKGRPVKQKAYCLAIAAQQAFPGSATSWSLAVDQLAYNKGDGRIICVSMGNVKAFQKSFYQNFPTENHLHKIEDPAQAANVLSVGAYTKHTGLPPDQKYSSMTALAKKDGISPHTKSGAVTNFRLPIKPDIVFEGGNFAVDKSFMHDDQVPTLTAVSTGHDPKYPLVPMYGTSLASALATRFCLEVWKSAPKLRPETIRGLVVHSATWTQEMLNSMNNNLNDVLALCGYGVPSLEMATYCTKDRATVIIEDEVANLVQKSPTRTSDGERQMKLFTLPLPKDLLLNAQNKEVELRITLSYFSEPNSARGVATRGMDLAWDVQGPAESDQQFIKRINDAMRDEGEEGPGTRSFNWQVGPQKRKRGTIQSDRWRGNAADLAGSRLIAVFPRYGWWNQRKKLKFNKTKFSLIVTVNSPDLEVYNYVKQHVEVPVQQPVTVKVTRK